MLILQLFDNPRLLLFFIIALVLVITIHEFSHAYIAYSLGDMTPKYQRRLSLNPLRHLDLFGTLALFIIGFGWGKPVMYNPNNLKHGKFDEFLIALAGPLSSILLALIFAIPYRLAYTYNVGGIIGTNWFDFTNLVTELSLIIAAFNILPIPPLDGSKFLYLFLPENWKASFEKIGTVLLFALLFISLFSGFNFLINAILKISSWLEYLVRVFPNGLF